MKVKAWIIIDMHGRIINELYFSEYEAFEDTTLWDASNPIGAPHTAYKIANVRPLECYESDQQL